MGMSYLDLSHSLADAFNALADEAQGLNDRRIVLEHKLRFAHEQLQYLADKYAPDASEVTESLAKLQLPPHTSVDDTSAVPLPQRAGPRSQHEIALVIRDGRRVASQLASMGEASKTTASTRDTYSRTSNEKSSMSTALEQDFTVEGKRGNLQCPFQPPPDHDEAAQGEGEHASHEAAGPKSNQHEDPMCAAMYEESTSQAPTNGASGSKCPIRFMDQHSPEEIARYVETHKHELPRSHEVCLRRYQHEAQARKLDSKYGNMISMIEGLGQLHQPMLPGDEQGSQYQEEVDKASHERVEDWANDVTATSIHADDHEAGPPAADASAVAEREGHFDRPLKEVRVGESPSRPWGISVPVYEHADHEDQQPFSPPPAPVRMPSPAHNPKTPVKSGGKCPFDHTKLPGFAPLAASPSQAEGHPPITPQPPQHPSFTPGKEENTHQSPHLGQPAFISPETAKGSTAGGPQMVFTGPVFIGYPVEQAMQILNQYRPSNP